MPSPAPAADWLLNPVLRGRFVTLEPLGVAHAEALAAGADGPTVEFLSRGGPLDGSAAAWATHI